MSDIVFGKEQALLQGIAAKFFREKSSVEVVRDLIDTETGFIRLGLARAIAQAMEAKYIQLEDLRSETLADAVRQELPGFDPDGGGP